MKVERFDGGLERRIAVAMNADKRTLARIAHHWEDPGLFPSRWANVLGQMAVKYYRTYGEAPGANLPALFASWAGSREAQGDSETVRAVERFLADLDGQYEGMATDANPELVADQAGRLFSKVKLRRLIDQLQGHLDLDQLEEAEKAVTGHRKVEMGRDGYTDLLGDAEALRDALESNEGPPLVAMPGALGRFWGRELDRDCFVSFLAPEKRGKSWFLIDLAWRALLQRRRVVFFAVGDMTRPQMERRLAVRALKRPLKPRRVRWPTALEYDDDQQVFVTHQERAWDEAADWREAWAAYREVRTRYVKHPQGFFRLVCEPAGTCSVAKIKARCERWAQDDWPPDVVVIDYADLLAPPPGFREARDGINATWVELRALSQSQHCLVVTATQANSESYRRHTLDMRNFSEDKRKLAHVTGMVGINSTPSEKARQLARLNWLVLREDEFAVESCVHVAQCLALAQPAVRSLM